MTSLPTQANYRAIQTKDARFDGRLYVGVTSTGIYCRPICPARTPSVEHCRFFASAAAAQEAGFRPCLRCRPETAPELARWHGTATTVSRALTLIADGALDGTADVSELAQRLGIGERHLRRLFQEHLGASPIAVAQTRRVLFAKQLIHETEMPMARIAHEAGFGSIRRFNETFQLLFQRPPSALRRRQTSAVEGPILLHLYYRPPYHWDAMLEFLTARAVTGVEVVEAGVYARTIRVGGLTGGITVRHVSERRCLQVKLQFPRSKDVRVLPVVVRQVRRLFDLDADIQAIEGHLGQDAVLGELVKQRGGLRSPGAWDGFEVATRAILGQQIGVGAARQLAAQLVAICGEAVEPGTIDDVRLTHTFPTAQRVADADLAALRVPGARRKSLQALAAAVADRPDVLERAGSLEEAVERLKALPGIGPWTAEYIALRLWREPDAFPATDGGLLRGAGRLRGEKVSPEDLVMWAEAWRPWRAYAAQHLWMVGGQVDSVAVKGREQ